jgi:hypothetical protein
MKAARTMKARRDGGRCPLCHTLMRTGQQISRTTQRGSWVHTRCWLARYRPTTDQRST